MSHVSLCRLTRESESVPQLAWATFDPRPGLGREGDLFAVVPSWFRVSWQPVTGRCCLLRVELAGPEDKAQWRGERGDSKHGAELVLVAAARPTPLRPAPTHRGSHVMSSPPGAPPSGATWPRDQHRSG